MAENPESEIERTTGTTTIKEAGELRRVRLWVVDREKKKVYAKVSLPNKERKKLSGNQILGILNQVCKKEIHYYNG